MGECVVVSKEANQATIRGSAVVKVSIFCTGSVRRRTWHLALTGAESNVMMLVMKENSQRMCATSTDLR